MPVICALLTKSLPPAAAEAAARMKRVSDEALLELDQLTRFLMAKRKARPPR